MHIKTFAQKQSIKDILAMVSKNTEQPTKTACNSSLRNRKLNSPFLIHSVLTHKACLRNRSEGPNSVPVRN